MKKVLKIIAIGLAVIAFGLVSFVWWALQPRPDPQSLPPTLIAADSPEGQTLLGGAEGIADY